MPDFQSLHLEVLDFSIGAVTPLRIGSVSPNAIRGMFNANPSAGRTCPAGGTTMRDAGVGHRSVATQGKAPDPAGTAAIILPVSGLQFRSPAFREPHAMPQSVASRGDFIRASRTRSAPAHPKPV